MGELKSALPLDIPHYIYKIVLMRGEYNLGEFEQVVLLAILRLSDNAYGVSIRQEISVNTRRNPTAGAIYTTLDRLESKGLVRSSMGGATPERGGRAKRYFKVTSTGARALKRARDDYERLASGLTLFGGENYA
jgi:DNA-binding PadR family transcriptional regulator